MRAESRKRADVSCPCTFGLGDLETLGRLLEVRGAGVDQAGFAGVAAFDAADAEEFFAAALQVGFDGFHVGAAGTIRIMPTPMLKDCSKFVGIDFSELGEIFEDRRDGPGIEIDMRFDAAG